MADETSLTQGSIWNISNKCIFIKIYDFTEAKTFHGDLPALVIFSIGNVSEVQCLLIIYDQKQREKKLHRKAKKFDIFTRKKVSFDTI